MVTKSHFLVPGELVWPGGDEGLSDPPPGVSTRNSLPPITHAALPVHTLLQKVDVGVTFFVALVY